MVDTMIGTELRIPILGFEDSDVSKFLFDLIKFGVKHLVVLRNTIKMDDFHT